MTDPDPITVAAVARAFGPGAALLRCEPMTGDASTRTYQRVVLAGAPVPSAVAMRFAPESIARSDEAVAGPAPAELPFLDVQRAARSRGVRVPALYADLSTQGCLLLEDLGDDTLFRVLGRTPRAQWEPLYARAVDLLAAWQRAFAPPAGSSVAYTRRFDRALLRWELDHFREWGLEALRGPLPSSARAALDAHFDALADEVAAFGTTVVHRDWQSKNLMLLGDELVVIDFQDALVGPRPYDLVALLCDSYTDLTLAEQTALVTRHLDNTGAPSVDREAFAREFWIQCLQRKLKDAGRFVFIDRVRKNPSFLQYIPQSVRHVHRALAVLPDRGALHALLAELAPEWFGPAAPR